jgi:hypothetical protein
MSRSMDVESGHALESIGHAIDYLVESRMFMIDVSASGGDREAISILARLIGERCVR